MTLREAFTQYRYEVILTQGLKEKTWKNHVSALNSIEKIVGESHVRLITLDNIIGWKMDMDKRGMAASSISRNLCCLRNVFKYLRSRQVNVIDPKEITLPKIKAKPPTYLQHEEVDMILDVIESPRDKALVACLFATGCRISELLNLNRDDIKDKRAEIIGKGDKPGTVYFDDRSMEYLEEYLETRHDKLKPLFVSGQYRRITVSRVQQLLHVYADLADIEKNVTPHVIRHTFASDLKRNGADIYDIKELLRHERISSTMIYTHVNDSYKQSAYEKFHTKKR